MNVLDLFSGIGGFSLGLERAGMRTVAFCEIEPYCRAVLAKHWPDVPCYTDIRELTATQLAADGISVDVICGGFPCQDISVAGKGAGLAGARSGLWSHYARLIGEIRPKYVIVENVSALLSRGLAEVLGELASLGYDAEWHCIPAAYVGAPHRRDRVWIVAYPGGDELRNESGRGGGESRACASEPGDHGEARPMADAESRGARRRRQGPDAQSVCVSEDVADARRAHGDGRKDEQEPTDRPTSQRDQTANHAERCGQVVGDAEHSRFCWRDAERRGTGSAMPSGWWESEPDVGRVAHGVPSRVDRLKSLGNAVVPQIPEIIGRAIMSQCSRPTSSEQRK